MKKMIMLSLLALTGIATQAQTQKKVEITKGPSYMLSVPDITLDKKTKKTIVQWKSTENNSWHEDIGVLDNVPVIDSESIESAYLNMSPTASEPKGYTSMTWLLADEGDNTVLHCYFRMPADIVKNFWLGNAESCILDKETGVIYQARSTVPERCYNKVFSVNGKEGTVLDLQILFPRLPETVHDMVIYGVPNWYMRGSEVKRVQRLYGAVSYKESYDTIPQFHMARMVKESVNYNKDSIDSWAVYKDAHLIKPVKKQTMALWRTREATYLAIATEQNWIREYYGRGGNTILLGKNGRQYKCKGVMGYPDNDLFWLEGYPGDYFAIVLVFEPLPSNVDTFNYVVPEGEPFNAWGANWKGEIISNLNVQQLRENQHLFKYHPRVVVK